MIQVIDTDVDRVTSDSLQKAQEDFDLVADFAAWLRLQRETVVLLDDDPIPSVPMMQWQS